MMYAMSAILFFYMVAQAFTGKAKAILAPMKIVDSSSYMIYLTHCLVLVVTNDWLTNRGIYELETRFALRALSVYLISIGLCVLWRVMRLVLLRRKS